MTDSTFMITSKNNSRIVELSKKKNEPSSSFFLIEGKHLVDMAFESGQLKEVYSTKPVDYPNIPVTLVSLDVLKKLAFSPSPSGIIAVAHKIKRDVNARKVLFLDRVQDPGNVGTLLRTALAFGYHRVILSKGCASPFGYKVIASSQGAIFSLDIEENVDAIERLNQLKQQGYHVISSCLRGAKPLGKVPPIEGNFVLILGNEGHGVDPKILDLSSSLVKIEMEGIESLNVGIAGGILMYRL